MARPTAIGKARSKKPRVALLFFGQPRFTTNSLAHDSHVKYIVEPYDADVFAYLWHAENAQYSASAWTGLGSNIVHPDCLQHLNDRFPGLKLKTEPPKIFDPEILIPKEKMLGILESSAPAILSQLYIFEQAGKFLEGNANISNYDFIIISRTDLYIRQFPNLCALDEGFYISSHHQRFPDFLFILSPKYLAFTRVFRNLNRVNWDAISEFTPENIKKSSLSLEFPGVLPVSLPLHALDVEIIRNPYKILTLIRNWRRTMRYYFPQVDIFRKAPKHWPECVCKRCSQ